MNGDRSVGLRRALLIGQRDIPFLLPPSTLMARVHGSSDEVSFASGGFQMLTDLLTALEPHRPIPSFRRILDWGCGCGRLLRHALVYLQDSELHGCDIDTEAIAWSDLNLIGASFRLVGVSPPTSYESNSFDLIYGVSVLTHMDEEHQFAWLDELRRILRPGGILLVTFHGRSFLHQLSPEHRSVVTTSGFLAVDDPVGVAFAPPGYYKMSYHSVGYIREHWLRYFDLLGIIERGMLNHQDLAVLTR